MRQFATVTIAAIALAITAGAARANVYNGIYGVAVTEGLTNGQGFQTVNVNPFPPSSNTVGAAFTYTGKLNFSNTSPQNSTAAGDLNSAFGFSTSNISNYSSIYGTTVVSNGATVADYTTLAGFLGSSGSASSYKWGSLYAFDLDVLSVGTVLTITHDDGASVYQGSTQVGITAIGPTTQVTDTVTIGTAGDTFLLYSRKNGTPSILKVTVPEPMSLSLLGAGLAGLGLVRRKARKFA